MVSDNSSENRKCKENSFKKLVWKGEVWREQFQKTEKRLSLSRGSPARKYEGSSSRKTVWKEWWLLGVGSCTWREQFQRTGLQRGVVTKYGFIYLQGCVKGTVLENWSEKNGGLWGQWSNYSTWVSLQKHWSLQHSTCPGCQTWGRLCREISHVDRACCPSVETLPLDTGSTLQSWSALLPHLLLHKHSIQSAKSSPWFETAWMLSWMCSCTLNFFIYVLFCYFFSYIIPP